MNSQNAFNLLGLPENASAADIQGKYNELFNEYQIRISNAPTPNVKKLYQKNLEELNEALNILNPSAAAQSDLPASGPSFSLGAQAKKLTESTPPKAPAYQPSAPERSQTPKTNTNATIIAAFFAVVGVAAAVFFGLKNRDLDNKLAEYGNIKLTNDSLLRFNRYFTNSKFKVKNEGKMPFTIESVIVYYRNDKNDLVKYFGPVNREVKPGEIDSLSYMEGNKMIWDGSVISYYCKLIYNGSAQHWSGLWVKDAQADGVFKINPE